MASLNLSSDGPSINNSYQKIINSQPPSGSAASSPTYGQWALFTVQAPLASAFQQDSGKESVLRVQTVGEGELIDLIEDFSEGRIQFAFVKVKDPNTGLPKSVLIAWCGDGVPERTKGYFTSHVNAVAKVLYGYHVQITARSTSDLTPESIVQKVADSSGSKYSGGGNIPSAGRTGPAPPVASKPIMPTKSFGGSGGFQALGSRSRAPQPAASVDQDGWGTDAPPVVRSQLEKVDSAYKPTKVDINELQSQHQPSRYQAPAAAGSNADVVSGSYTPIGKVDINAIRRDAQEKGSLQDDRPTVTRGAYEPTGKVDIAEIRRKAQAGSAPAPAQPSPPATSADDERPRSLAERSAAFSSSSNSERLTSMPKPAVSNRFGGQTSSFAGTKAPVPGGFEAKPNMPSAAPVGMASKNFADQGGKTPAQQWADRKARERGNSAAADTQGFGAPVSPLQSQTSGGWQSGYVGKKWGVQIPAKSGTGTISSQRTGDEEPPSEQYDETTAPSGGIGSIRDRFKDAAPMGATRDSFGSAPEPPPLDTANKPNSGVRGVPIPGLPQRTQAPQDLPEEEHHDLPPPPPRPIPQDEQEEEDDYDQIPQGAGSPVRIAMPVARGPEPEPLEKAEPLPPRPMPTASLDRVATDNLDPEPEAHVHADEPARAAGLAAAATTFGAATDSRSAGTSGGRSAIAQYDYEKAEDNELGLRENERVTNIDMVDEDWWMGTNERGESGLFPANYVDLLPEGQDSDDHAPAPAAQLPIPAPMPDVEHSAVAPPAGPPGGTATPSAVAQYDYEAAEDNELSFPDGATVTDIEFPDEDWWFGHYNGRSGLFPANYVQLNE